MNRVVLAKGKQQDFLVLVKNKTELKWDELGERAGVCGRTLRDWQREIFLGSYEALLKLSKISGIKLPEIKEIRKEHWSVHKAGKIGAIRRNEIYGSPGTLESRRKGGLVSQQRRRERPEFYKSLGCIVRNKFPKPSFSSSLAELTGIILGDGGITNTQLTITLDYKTDREYSDFVANLIFKIFDKRPTISKYSHRGTLAMRLSGINLVDILEELGLERGDKVRNQIDFPDWIKGNLGLRKACVRGLFDTDGGLYFHRHWTKGIKYRNLGFCFTSYSKPLITSFFATLKESGYNCKLREVSTGGRVFIYSLKEIKRYFSEISSNNPKHTKKLDHHLSKPNRLS